MLRQQHDRRLRGAGVAASGADNLDRAVIDGFGAEWRRFDQRKLLGPEFDELFKAYFAVFPWADLSPRARGFDLGCGSGRWAREVAGRAGLLYCIDPSLEALMVSRQTLAGVPNARVLCASAGALPFPDASMDFGYCLGVLHHVPDLECGLRDAVRTLRPGAPLLLYLYYRFENRPVWYRLVWRVSDWLRRCLCRLPFALRSAITDVIAVVIYWPLARLAFILQRLGIPSDQVPLAAYRCRSLYVMRTDALDRFGTRLERRLTRAEIAATMARCGLTDVRFSEEPPFWTAVGRRACPPGRGPGSVARRGSGARAC